MNETVNQRFKKVRESLHITQEKLAEKFGLKQPNITDVERGKTFPNPIMLENLHKLYNINLNWLITGKGKMKIDGYNIGDEMHLVEENNENYSGQSDKHTEVLEKLINILDKLHFFLENIYEEKRKEPEAENCA